MTSPRSQSYIGIAHQYHRTSCTSVIVNLLIVIAHQCSSSSSDCLVAELFSNPNSPSNAVWAFPHEGAVDREPETEEVEQPVALQERSFHVTCILADIFIGGRETDLHIHHEVIWPGTFEAVPRTMSQRFRRYETACRVSPWPNIARCGHESRGAGSHAARYVASCQSRIATCDAQGAMCCERRPSRGGSRRKVQSVRHHVSRVRRSRAAKNVQSRGRLEVRGRQSRGAGSRGKATWTAISKSQSRAVSVIKRILLGCHILFSRLVLCGVIFLNAYM